MNNDIPVVWSPGLLLAPFVRQPNLEPTQIDHNDYLQTLLVQPANDVNKMSLHYDPINSPSGKATSALNRIGIMDTLITNNLNQAMKFLQSNGMNYMLQKPPTWLFTSYDLHPKWLEPITTSAINGIQYLNLQEVPLIESIYDKKIIGGTFQFASDLLGWIAIPPRPIRSEQELHNFVKITEENLQPSPGLVKLSFPSIAFDLITSSTELQNVKIKDVPEPISESILRNKFALNDQNVNPGIISEKSDRYDAYIYPPAELIVRDSFVLALGLPNYGIVWAAYLPRTTWQKASFESSQSITSTPSLISKTSLSRNNLSNNFPINTKTLVPAQQTTLSQHEQWLSLINSKINQSSNLISTNQARHVIYSPMIPFLFIYDLISIKPNNTEQTNIINEIIDLDSIRTMAAISKFGKIKIMVGDYNQTVEFAALYGMQSMIKPINNGIYAITSMQSGLQLEAIKEINNKFKMYQVNSVKSWLDPNGKRNFLISLSDDIGLIIKPKTNYRNREELFSNLAHNTVHQTSSDFDLDRIKKLIDKRFNLIIPAFEFRTQVNFSNLNGSIVETKLGQSGPIAQILVEYYIKFDGKLISNVYQNDNAAPIILDEPFTISIVSSQVGLLLTFQVDYDNFTMVNSENLPDKSQSNSLISTNQSGNLTSDKIKNNNSSSKLSTEGTNEIRDKIPVVASNGSTKEITIIPNEIISLLSNTIKSLDQPPNNLYKSVQESEQKMLDWLINRINLAEAGRYKVIDVKMINFNRKSLFFDLIKIDIIPNNDRINLEFYNQINKTLYIGLQINKILDQQHSNGPKDPLTMLTMEFFRLNPRAYHKLNIMQLDSFKVLIADDIGIIKISDTLSIWS